MKIVDIRATTIAMPLEAPLRHAGGAHWGRFVRTIVEFVTDDGIVGLGELGGGGESAEASVRGLLSYIKGHDPLQLEQLRWKIMNPTASLYNNRMQVHAAIEMACMDAAGKRLDIRACDLLGGALRERIPFASYIFYRLPNEQTGTGGEASPDESLRTPRRSLPGTASRPTSSKAECSTPTTTSRFFALLARHFQRIACASIRMPRGPWSRRSA